MRHSKNFGKTASVNPEKGFKIHLLVFVLTTPILWLVWYFTDKSYPWPLWSTPAWTIGILFHFSGVHVFRKKRIAHHLKIE